MSVLESHNKDSYGGGIIGEITSLSSSLKMVDIHGEGFLLLLLYFQKWHMDVWISELYIFNCNKSLKSSQDFPDVITSVIKVHVKPFNLA